MSDTQEPVQRGKSEVPKTDPPPKPVPPDIIKIKATSKVVGDLIANGKKSQD